MPYKRFQKIRSFFEQIRHFKLSPPAVYLLLTCLFLHVVYSACILIAFKIGRISVDMFAIHFSQIWESQVLALLLTVVGVGILDIECKHKNINKK